MENRVAIYLPSRGLDENWKPKHSVSWVGPMTIAVLLRNTLVAAYNHAGLDQPEGL